MTKLLILEKESRPEAELHLYLRHHKLDTGTIVVAVKGKDSGNIISIKQDGTIITFESKLKRYLRGAE